MWSVTVKEVKIAVHMPFGMTGSLAQIYRLLTEADTLFNIQIFHSVEECAEYLEVDRSELYALGDRGRE